MSSGKPGTSVRWVIAVTVTASIALAVTVMIFVVQPSKTPSKTSVESQEKELPAQLVALQEQVSRIERRALKAERSAALASLSAAETRRERASTAEEAEAAAEVEDSEPELDREALIERERQRTQARQRLALNVLEAEAVDVEWKAEVEAEVAETMAALDETKFAGTRLSSLRCGSTLCEVQVEHATKGEMLRFPEHFRSSAAPNVFGRTEPGDQEGTFISFVYAARKGHYVPK